MLTNKHVYLGLSILELSKTVIYELWYDYAKTKYGEKTKLCYMDTDSFIVCIKTDDDVYKGIAKIVETRFDFSNFESERPKQKGRYKRVIDLMKDKVRENID